jgi:hypothetical protein
VSDYQPSPPPATPYVPAGQAEPQSTPVLSIISLIGGIVAVLLAFFLGWIPFVGAIIALLVAIAAVVLGHLGQRREVAAKGFWLTGLITGYVGGAIALLWLAFWIIVVVAAAANQSR